MFGGKRPTGAVKTAISPPSGCVVDANAIATGKDSSAPGGKSSSIAPGSGFARSTTQLNGLQTLVSRWVRIDVDWSAVQAAGPTSYDWSQTDPPSCPSTVTMIVRRKEPPSQSPYTPLVGTATRTETVPSPAGTIDPPDVLQVEG